jgi:hypothetical protein
MRCTLRALIVWRTCLPKRSRVNHVFIFDALVIEHYRIRSRSRCSFWYLDSGWGKFLVCQNTPYSWVPTYEMHWTDHEARCPQLEVYFWARISGAIGRTEGWDRNPRGGLCRQIGMSELESLQV